MRSLTKAIYKILGAFLALSTLVAFANGFFGGLHFSDQFMSEDTFSIVDNFDIQEDVRSVASAEREFAVAQYLPANKENKKLVNKKWEITRIVNEKEEVVFDVNKREEDKNKVLILPFEMVGTSQVRIDGDDALIFDISRLHEKGLTILLFRSFGQGYEIIEAKKVTIKDRFKRGLNKVANLFGKGKQIEELEAQDNIEKRKGVDFKLKGETLLLERAIVPTQKNGVFKGEQVSGTLVLGDSTINSMEVLISAADSIIEIPMLIDIRVNDGGQFSFENNNGDVVSGVITNNGNDGYRVRIATGAYAGTMLNFVTSEEFDRISEKERAQREREEEIKAQKEQEKAYREEMKENEEEEKKQTLEDYEIEAETTSFFDKKTPKRLPASY